MSGASPRDVISLLRSQLCVEIPPPSASFEGQTVIVTGSNSGLGREAAKHAVQLGASKVILAVRTISKGEDARVYIEKETQRKGVLEVWELDMSKFASVKAFALKAEGLARLDCVIANAGMWPTNKELAEGHEATITVNVISPFLLAHLLLPILRRTSLIHRSPTRFTVVDSNLHTFATLKARKWPSIFSALTSEPLGPKDYDMRYNDSKLLVMLYGRALAAATPLSNPGPSDKRGNVVVNFVNPGYCHSSLRGDDLPLAERVGRKVIARSTDVGAYTLVDAVRPVTDEEARERHGAYMNDLKAQKGDAWLETSDGKETQARVWKELNIILEGIEPSVIRRL